VATLNLTGTNDHRDHPVSTQLTDGHSTVFRAHHSTTAFLCAAPTPHSTTAIDSGKGAATSPDRSYPLIRTFIRGPFLNPRSAAGPT